jgi:hypothetical protein
MKIRNGYAIAAKARRNAGPMIHKQSYNRQKELSEEIETATCEICNKLICKCPKEK